MSKKTKVILIHGNSTIRWSYAWMPWIKKELEKLGCNVVAETFPDSIIARERFWIPFLEEYLETDENTILVGHSSGAVCAMRYAENHKILGSVLISPCYTDLGDSLEKQSGYYEGLWLWNQIKENQKWIVQFGSKDDPLIPVEEFRHINEKLDSEYTEFKDKGHFMDKKFPELLDVIKNKLN